MIKPKELRLGNLIEWAISGDTGTVEEIRQNTVRARYVSDKERTAMSLYEDIDPVSLTEEWLEKFGFVKTMSTIIMSDIEYIDYRMPQFVCFLLSGGKGVEVEFSAKHNTIEERGYLTNVKYAHQLQNLYFALTGKELSYER